MEARVKAGLQPGDVVHWKSKPANNKTVAQKNAVREGKFVGYLNGDLLVRYSVSLGKGATKDRQVIIKCEQVIDVS